MPIGAHVSTSGGLPSAVKRAIDLGAECVQIFLSPPQRWDRPRHTDEQVEEFARQMRAARVGPNFAHARYLINLASQDASIRGRSIDALATCAAWAERCDLIGVVVHIGSGRGQPMNEAMRHVADGLRQVLEGGGTARILLENSAGSGNMQTATRQHCAQFSVTSTVGTSGNIGSGQVHLQALCASATHATRTDPARSTRGVVSVVRRVSPSSEYAT
jgi:endonuclease IV